MFDNDLQRWKVLSGFFGILLKWLVVILIFEIVTFILMTIYAT